MDAHEERANTSENVIEFQIYPAETTNSIHELKDDIMGILTKEVSGYIWQTEPFSLDVKEEESVACHITGQLEYGDNIEDLWYLTFLLLKLTKHIPGLVAKAQDNDGEFLLIEAADFLPKWVTPESAENRVYLYSGDIHLIPQKLPGVTLPTGVPRVMEAASLVRRHSALTRAADKIQWAIQQRVARYPEYALHSMHSMTCYLPVSAARVLRERPQLASAAVRAFYLRDPIDLKACTAMKHFPPTSRVKAKVKFSRCLFAQLSQQKFYPVKRSAWNMPPATHPEHTAYDIGMKLAHGLEILCAGCTAQPNPAQEDGTGWLRYKQALEKHGYFQEEIEGSIKYQQLLSEARQFYSSQSELSHHSHSDRRSQGSAILHLLGTSTVTDEQLGKEAENLPPDDDDGWLSMTFEQLDDMLAEYGAGKSNQFNPSQVVDTMSAFINKESNILTGVKVPNSEEIKFDDKGFLAAIERMMKENFRINGGNSLNDNDGGDEELDSDDSSLDEYESDDSLTEHPPSKPANASAPSAKSTHGSSSKAKLPNGSFTATKMTNKNSHSGDAKPEIEDFMQLMDRELSRTNVGKSFEKRAKPPATASLAEGEELSDDEAVDVDLNTVKNLLESYSSQMGLPGPTSNLLESMGVALPQNTD